MPWLVGVGMIGWPATEEIELDPLSTEERLRQLFAVYGSNGTEFCYAIFTEQRNFTTTERKPGIMPGLHHSLPFFRCR